MTSSDLPADDVADRPAALEVAAPAVPVLHHVVRSFTPLRAEFRGTGREYFQIWIVNLLLTIVTLGVYSPWAKVRRLQYFHRHTRLGGAGFDYHGDPIAILKGRVIAVVLFVGYTAAGEISIWHGFAAAGVIALILPWMLAKSLRFRLQNTSYRGLRFHFDGSVRSAYWVFLGLPILSIMLWLVPFTHHRIKRYQHANAAYGRTRFSFRAPVADFYVIWVGAAGIGMGFMFLLIIASVAAAGFGLIDLGNAGSNDDVFVLAIVMPIYVTALVAVRAFFRAGLQRVVWEHTLLDRHSFAFDLAPMRLFWIMLTNLLTTIATVGLFRPFAQVRLAKCLAASFIAFPRTAFEEMTAADDDHVGAAGEEAAEIFNFDMSF